MIYPPRCLACGAETETERGLCGNCWHDTHFISGLVCSACGVPLPGPGESIDTFCDACLHTPPAWNKGRAAVLYEGAGRRVVLALKHGDRLDIAKPLAGWMLVRGHDLITPGTIVVPVPLHWRRLLRRRYNQASLLAQHIAFARSARMIPDFFKRRRCTVPQLNMSREERFANQADAIEVAPKCREAANGASLLIVDDVMTTGATLSACTEAALATGARQVNILVLARVARPG
jgi:ComF family protein